MLHLVSFRPQKVLHLKYLVHHKCITGVDFITATHNLSIKIDESVVFAGKLV